MMPKMSSVAGLAFCILSFQSSGCRVMAGKSCRFLYHSLFSVTLISVSPFLLFVSHVEAVIDRMIGQSHIVVWFCINIPYFGCFARFARIAYFCVICGRSEIFDSQRLGFWHYSLSPYARSPASPRPGTIYACSLMMGSTAAHHTVVLSAGNVFLTCSIAFSLAMMDAM